MSKVATRQNGRDTISILCNINRFVQKEEKMGPISELIKIYNAPMEWSNKHTCPEGYKWNEFGWVQTDIMFLQVTVNMLPYMLNRLGEYGVMYQNAIALRYLNPKKHRDQIRSALYNRFKFCYLRLADDEILDRAIENAYSIENIKDVLPNLSKEIFYFYDIWFSSDCPLEGRKQIQAIIKQDYIAKSRSLMSISTKYITKEVMSFADVSEYAVKKHWDELGFSKKDRTTLAIMDAIALLEKENKEITEENIVKIAGVSLKTLGRQTKEVREIQEKL